MLHTETYSPYGRWENTVVMYCRPVDFTLDRSELFQPFTILHGSLLEKVYNL